MINEVCSIDSIYCPVLPQGHFDVFIQSVSFIFSFVLRVMQFEIDIVRPGLSTLLNLPMKCILPSQADRFN